MQQHNIVGFCQESTCFTTQDQCRKGSGKLRTLDLLKFGLGYFGLSLLTGIKIRVEWYFHVSFMLRSWSSHCLLSTQREGSSNRKRFTSCGFETYFITGMNGLKAYTIKKGTSHKVPVSALVEDYTCNSPETALLLEAFGIKEITIQIPRCLFTSDFFIFLFFFNLKISTSCILLMILILKVVFSLEVHIQWNVKQSRN